MSIVSYQFCPLQTCAHHVFCTLFSCLSIDSSLYHVIFRHVTVFSVFVVKVKLNLWPLVRILITHILINCEWFIIKLCGIGIILLTDLLCEITFYHFSIVLRFDCIFKTTINDISVMYMWRHIDVLADWRISWAYGRTPNVIDIS